MVTSRKDRKCSDSSSAGRAGIFYCSSWRMVCWLPVPPPAGAENTTHVNSKADILAKVVTWGVCNSTASTRMLSYFASV